MSDEAVVALRNILLDTDHYAEDDDDCRADIPLIMTTCLWVPAPQSPPPLVSPRTQSSLD